MQLEKATHKRVLYVAMLSAKFSIDKLADASGAAKKLLDGAERDEQQIQFVDKSVEFTAEEWLILKDTVKGIAESGLDGADSLLELRKTFEL